MQRLARITLTEENQKAVDLFNQFKEIRQFLVRHLPPSTLQLFAEPVVKGNIVEWYSNLEGQPVKLSGKPPQGLLDDISNKLTSINNLVFDLQSKNQISVEKAQLIRTLLEAVNYSEKEIYSINNEAVIVGWGLGVPPSLPPVANVAATVPSFSKHRWCCWLLPLLLLLLGLLAWWWFYLRQPDLPPVPPEPLKTEETVKNEEVKPESSPKVEKFSPRAAESPKENDQAQIKALPKKVEEPVVEKPKIDEAPKPKVEPVKKEEPKKNCTVKMTKPEELPQMVVVFDNSPSMLSSLEESYQALEIFWEKWRYGRSSIDENRYMLRAPNRLGTAKSASSSIIDNVAANVPIGLVTLSTCPAADNHGFYNQKGRGALKAKIKNIYPFVDNNYSTTAETGTPLYSGIQQAASMVDGVNRDAFILVISDGEDSCRTGDVCYLAQQIAKQKPRLKINVVDIGGAKGANCVAVATGGKVFTANNRKQILNMINQAVKPMQTEEICK